MNPTCEHDDGSGRCNACSRVALNICSTPFYDFKNASRWCHTEGKWQVHWVGVAGLKVEPVCERHLLHALLFIADGMQSGRVIRFVGFYPLRD